MADMPRENGQHDVTQRPELGSENSNDSGPGLTGTTLVYMQGSEDSPRKYPI